MHISNLRDLLEHHLHDLRSAEEQIIEALPVMIGEASDNKLQAALEEHLTVTEEQLSRLDDVFEQMGITAKKQECMGMQGIIEEGQKTLEHIKDPATKDAAIISAAQKVEHYEIAGYGTSAQYARELDMDDIASLLEQTLGEEEQADADLTALAEGGLFSEGINQEAADE